MCLSCLNFDRFIVLTSVGFGTMVEHVKGILQQCVPPFCCARLVRTDNVMRGYSTILSQCHITHRRKFENMNISR